MGDGQVERVPVFLVHWNRPEWLAASVASLEGGAEHLDITVVNNGPQPDEDLVRILPSGVTVVSSGGNLGYAGGANLALERWLAGDDELCFVGAHDVHIVAGGLDRLCGLAAAHPGFGIIGPTLRGKRWGANSVEARAGRTGDLLATDWVSGTGMLLRRSCITQIQGFDRVLGSYSEDVDLCLRAGRAGWKVGLAGEVEAWGLGSGEPSARRESELNAVRVDWINRRRALALQRLARLVGRFAYLHGCVLLRVGSEQERAVHRSQARQLRAVFGRARVLWQPADTALELGDRATRPASPRRGPRPNRPGRRRGTGRAR